MKEQIRRIVAGYQEWLKFCELSNFDPSDEELYDEWLERTAEEETQSIVNDLTDLCEDNEVMREVIKDYFSSI